MSNSYTCPTCNGGAQTQDRKTFERHIKWGHCGGCGSRLTTSRFTTYNVNNVQAPAIQDAINAGYDALFLTASRSTVNLCPDCVQQFEGPDSLFGKAAQSAKHAELQEDPDEASPQVDPVQL